MMKLVLAFYDNCRSALDQGAGVEALVRLEVREQIGRFKYIHDTDQEDAYERIMKELAAELANLAVEEDGTNA